MKDIYGEIDRIIQINRDPRNTYNTYRAVKRYIYSLFLHPDDENRYIRYAMDRLGI